jgi:hypothetical protein
MNLRAISRSSRRSLFLQKTLASQAASCIEGRRINTLPKIEMRMHCPACQNITGGTAPARLDQGRTASCEGRSCRRGSSYFTWS